MLRKKQISIISVILAVLMLLNIITPVLALDTAQAASQSFIEAADYTLPVTAEAERPVLRDPPPPVYENGSILIYNYAQLLLIGTGSPVTELDALTDKVGSGDAVTDENDSSVVYGSDCQYVIMQDIPLPRHTVWSIPHNFTGSISGTPSDSPSLYDEDSDTVYIFEPYQLVVMNSQAPQDEPVMSGDLTAAAFGTGQFITTGGSAQSILTYSPDHNFVIASDFSSAVTAQPPSLVGGHSSSAAYEGRDFAGQVIKKIDGVTYILIGDQEQLRSIGSDNAVKVFTPVCQMVRVWDSAVSYHYEPDTDGSGNLILLYGGDADLLTSQNGTADFGFHTIRNAAAGKYYAGIDQDTGLPYTDTTRVTSNKNSLTEASWQTNETYSINANYIIFRDIDLQGTSRPWTPVMFSGSMYGAKSLGNKLWDGDAIGNAKNLAEAGRPVISNVYVDQTGDIEVNKYIGTGFFATITNEINTVEVGISKGTVKVSNIELSHVEIHNSSTTAKSADTIVNTITTGLGWLVGSVTNLLVKVLSIGEIELNLQDTLGNMLNARTLDPTIYATGGFVGRVIGDVEISGCSVTGGVTAESLSSYTGGFVGYTEGVTEYDGLSQTLGLTVDVLSSLLNVIPGLGLGDLITILLGGENTLPLENLIPTGYINPKFNSCTAEDIHEDSGAPAVIGRTDTDYNGGFGGLFIGAELTDCEVRNGIYTVRADEFGGGFTGLAHDAEIKGTLSDLGLDVIDESRLNSINTNLDGMLHFQTQSLLLGCTVRRTAITVDCGIEAGGFAGALAASYAVDCEMTGTQSETLTVTASGDNAGGFTGTATMGWLNSLGKTDNSGNNSLLSAVRQIATELLSSEDENRTKKLLSLVGLVPSALMGCRIEQGAVKVSGSSCVGGIIGKGQGVYLTESSAFYMNQLTYWGQQNSTVPDTKAAQPCVLSELHSVSAAGDYAGGAAGELETVSLAGVLDGAISGGSFKGFTVSDVTVTGMNSGYTVISDGTAPDIVSGNDTYPVNGDYIGGGFGRAYGGSINQVHLDRLQKVAAANNYAAGFIAAAGPGDVAGVSSLTVNLLGLNNLISVKKLLSIGQDIHVVITDSDVTGIDGGFTVTAGGSGDEKFTAAGFIAQSNSTELSNCHVYKLYSVKAAAANGYSGGFIGTSQSGGLTDVADDTSVNSLVDVNGLLSAVSYLIPSYTDCTVEFADNGFVDADIAGGFVADLESGTVDNTYISLVDDADSPRRSKNVKHIYDPDTVPADTPAQRTKQFAVFNLSRVKGRTYGGGFGGRLRSCALANAGSGISILGGSAINLSIDLNGLLRVVNAYVPYAINAGVWSEQGFTVEANEVRSDDPDSGSAGGFAGLMKGA